MQPIIVLYLLWVLWVLSWLAVVIVGDHAPHKLGLVLLVVYRALLISAGLLLFTITPWPGFDVQYRFWDRGPSEEIGWVLTAMGFLGFALAWWATIERLIALKPENGVVDRGPFRIIRQPAALGLIIVVLSTAASLGRPSSALGALLLVFAIVAKVLLEERVLRRESAAYEAYAERVPMLLPVPLRPGTSVSRTARREPSAAAAPDPTKCATP